MKKWLLVILASAVLFGCAQPKDIYFNGSEGSKSGLKFDKSTQSFKVNH